MKKIIISILTVLLISLCFGCTSTNNKQDQVELTQVFEQVFDIGTYTSLDYEFAEEYFAKEYDDWGGGCSAIAKTLSNGDTIVGRNMDLNISNKGAYIFRTDVKGSYKTINLAYTFRDISPDYKEVLANGLPEDYYKILPFMADDVLNEKGLYIEVNMRNGEFWPTGESKYSCDGTNPLSDTRVYMFGLSRYIGEHCATVDEAIEYVRSLNVYSKDGYWNYCFLIADATGHYGVLEFAANSVIWNDYHPCQTNFYIDDLAYYAEDLRCGVGRYDKLMADIDTVNNEDDMFELMDSVSYFQYYDPYNSQFDVRSEALGVIPWLTTDMILLDEYKEEILSVLEKYAKEIRAMDRQDLQDVNEYWESAFTEVVNCNKKTIKVRFFEDDNKIITLGFDE